MYLGLNPHVPWIGNGLSVMIIGDWGAPPSNQAFIRSQRLVARGMEQVLSAQLETPGHARPEFVVNLGDAFYMNGISDVKDHRFEQTFRFGDVAPKGARTK